MTISNSQCLLPDHLVSVFFFFVGGKFSQPGDKQKQGLAYPTEGFLKLKKKTSPYLAWSATHCFLFLQNSPLMNPANFGSFGYSFLTHGGGGAWWGFLFSSLTTSLPLSRPKRLVLPFPPQNQIYTNGRGMNYGDTVYELVTHCFLFLENIGLQTPNLDPSYTDPHSLRGSPYLCMQEWVANIVKNIKFLAANESMQPRVSAFFSNGPWLQNNIPHIQFFFFFFFCATAFCLLFNIKGKNWTFFFLS